MQRSLSRAALAALAALTIGGVTPLAAQKADEKHGQHDAHGADPDKAVDGGGVLPAGWASRTDDGSNRNVKFAPMGPGYHVTLGPATLLYRPADKVTIPFHTLATFSQTKAPSHPEGYGLFIGGRDLAGKGQRYTYFLVRGDGKYLVKQRVGDKTTTIQEWTEHPAINKADAAGKAVNKLEVANKVDPKTLTFGVNGQEVWSAPAEKYTWKGQTGLRVNHNLDVHVDGFALHQ
jgi:hypothetical protein